MPLKPVGCQVIEEAQSAQPHRHRSQSVSVAESRAEQSSSQLRERDPIIRGHGGEMGTRQRHRVGDRAAVVVGSL